MNDYQAIANDVVGPLRASAWRKIRIHEELLGHLAEIENRARQDGVSENELRVHALATFGDPDRIRADIQASVPRLERVLYFGLFNRKEGESDARYIGRASLIAAGVMVGQIPFTMGVCAFSKGRMPDITAMESLSIVGTLVAAVAFVFVALLFTLRTPRHVQLKRWRRLFLESFAFCSLTAIAAMLVDLPVVEDLVLSIEHRLLLGAGAWLAIAGVQLLSVCEAFWNVRRCPWKELGRDL